MKEVLRESRIYRDFFKNNFWLIVIPTIFLSLLTTALTYKYLPKSSHKNFLIEKDYEQLDILKKSTLTDEAIAQLRSSNVQKEIETHEGIVLSLVKVGPVLVNVDLSTKNSQINLDGEGERVKRYALDKFSFKQVGKDINYEANDNRNLFIAFGVFVSFSLGIILALVKSYLKTY